MFAARATSALLRSSPAITATALRGLSAQHNACIRNATTIANLHAREILDSRGNPTVEVELTDSKGQMFLADVPSGASTGDMEAIELRDGDKSRYLGKGVQKACANVVQQILPAVKGMSSEDIAAIDQKMIALDGTSNKANLGANAILGSPKMVMPVPCFNVINGGVHSGNYLAPQEFFLIPLGASDFKQALRMGSETYHHLKGLIDAKYGRESTAVGDEGGFAPNIGSVEEALDLLVAAIDEAGYTGKIFVGSDPAASGFYDREKEVYNFDFKRPLAEQDPSRTMKREEVVDFWIKMAEQYPVQLLEDPFDDLDFDGHKAATAALGKDVEIVGDDLYCTNPSIVSKGIEMDATNAMLLKVNQIGTITEAIKAYNLCRDTGWGVFVSHRSGETPDDFIADLTVALGTGHLKTGAPCRGERLAKYNQLLRIEERNNGAIGFAGYDFRKSGHF
ncbi:Enolase (Fragment) [Seminavis robusta]|uniref:phosphopyruvate hydratase n=1 Tax=Seminavis robusta TaxID=568900 RepID=A0A9N8EXW3_9STRA